MAIPYSPSSTYAFHFALLCTESRTTVKHILDVERNFFVIPSLFWEFLTEFLTADDTDDTDGRGNCLSHAVSEVSAESLRLQPFGHELRAEWLRA